jgi:hypothetical protein
VAMPGGGGGSVGAAGPLQGRRITPPTPTADYPPGAIAPDAGQPALATILDAGEDVGGRR